MSQQPSTVPATKAPMNPWLVAAITLVALAMGSGLTAEGMIFLIAIPHGMVYFVGLMALIFVIAPIVYACWQHKRIHTDAPAAQQVVQTTPGE